MYTHREEQARGRDLGSTSRFAVTPVTGPVCVFLPDYGGIPTYPMMQAWKRNRLLGNASQGT